MPSDLDIDEAISAVMCALTERITAGEAHELLEAVPPTVRAFFEVCVIHREGRPTTKLDRAEFLERVAEHLGVTPAHAELASEAVFAAIRSELPDEIARNVAQQLPRGLAQLWLAPPRFDAPAEATIAEDEARRSVESHIAAEVALPFDVTSAEAFAAVMCALSQRLSGGEARELLLGLPVPLRRLVDRCMAHRPEPSATFGKDELVRRVTEHVRMTPSEAEALVRATFAGVKRVLPEKVVHDVESQLPFDVRELWEQA